MQIMSSITPASWLQVGIYFFPAPYSSMDPCFSLVQGKIIQIEWNINKKKQIINENNFSQRPWFVLPYISGISDDFIRLKNTSKSKLAFRSVNKLNNMIKVQKDVLPRDKKKNVVYRIACKSCSASYVGQTSRKLKTRISE
ncbi:hypothetical protein ALC62_15379 [Cyphomyrmex costatus]|uniref:GIY-YIG domain-containing protein n=1 Tax=Cyphomyrmex costatus TaxID=456900 RepID=A0A151I7C7_9HYME|nr:hypothetical protein ALC62_15379 [Cyphomyrmex costatus]